jgi:hypothetical protein
MEWATRKMLNGAIAFFALRGYVQLILSTYYISAINNISFHYI